MSCLTGEIGYASVGKHARGKVMHQLRQSGIHGLPKRSVGERHGCLSQSLSVFALLLVAGCSGSQRPLPPLPDLHLPDVTQIPGITTLHTAPQLGYIASVATFRPVGQPAPRILFTVDGDLYSVGVDGSDPHSLQITCRDQVAVSPDGRWAVCVHADVYLAVISLTAAPPHNTRLLTLPAGPFAGALQWGSPTWLPDNRHVAVVTHLDSGCSVAVYTLSASYDQIQMAGLLNIPAFVTPGVGEPGCAVSVLSGSPDGTWLSFVGETHSRFTLYVLSVANVLTVLLQNSRPQSLTVSADQLIALGEAFLTAPSWSRHGTDWLVTFTNRDSQHLTQIDVSTRESSTVLGVQHGEITSSAWTPDSKHLVFANGQRACIECPPSFTPSHLYVYTPQA